MKKKIKKLMILLVTFIIFIMLLPTIIINIRYVEEIKNINEIRFYDYNDLMRVNNLVEVKFDKYNFSDTIKINLKINHFIDTKKYGVVCYLNDLVELRQNIQSEESDVYITLLEEGKNNLKVELYVDGEMNSEKSESIYYIKPYSKQFLDEISSNGICTHYNANFYENYEITKPLLVSLGVKNIRNDISLNAVYKNNKYDYSNNYYWLEDIDQNTDINIFALIHSNPLNKVKEKEDIEALTDFVLDMDSKYNVKYYEILNEANFTYKSHNEIVKYAQLVENIMDRGVKNVITSGTATLDNNSEIGITSIQFYKSLTESDNMKKFNKYSYHPYVFRANFDTMKEKLVEHREFFNNIGGFNYLYSTEYGENTMNYSEDNQANWAVKETIIQNEYNQYNFLYEFVDNGSVNDNPSKTFGLIYQNYELKKSYYAMKNYYENTNGAEYIGTINIADGLEAHVYDKDGKPVIITWSENSTNNIQIDYKDFTAKDLYGKDIQPDENGKLTITTSPVYLYDVDYNYFYKAISNVATSKYDEFKEKFATEISQISGFEEKINQRQNYSQSVANTQKLMQNTAITAMKSHYELGDIILKAYEEGQLKAEPVKISSMLDMINDIGNSYEDLVIVSVNNTINSVMKTLDEANVDSSELITTKQKIEETENLINTNTDVEIIYPTKILQFSKDCYEKADYINSLEEQNDIKAGLIISNNLHAQLLADWANKFASIQINNNINDYIAKNPVTIEYSETNITNKSVKATIKTDAEIQITNNSNSKEYVFNQNGSFTFEYTIKGQAKQITAKVTNIDKTSPTINGVVDGKLYTSKITPTITDENLDTIKLILNGEEVKNFKSGTTLTDEGFYTLTATDKAGNKTQISFQIMENNNQNYIVQDNTIKNISEQTTKSDFDNKLKLGVTYKITRNEKEIASTDNIATGDILITSAGDKYTLIVTGDLNKDGKVNLKDLVKIRKYILAGNDLDENEELAADCNSDGKINLKDLVKIRLMILNQDATK